MKKCQTKSKYAKFMTPVVIICFCLAIPVILTVLPILSLFWAFMTYSPFFMIVGIVAILGIIMFVGAVLLAISK